MHHAARSSEKPGDAVIIEPEYLARTENQQMRDVVTIRKSRLYKTADGVAHLRGVDMCTLRESTGSTLRTVASAAPSKLM